MADFITSSLKVRTPGGLDISNEEHLRCDICDDFLPTLVDPTNTIQYFDCFVHPYWVDDQILCPSCALTAKGCCLGCEVTIASPRERFCQQCNTLTPLLDFREAFTIKEFVLQVMKIHLKVDNELIQLLQRIPVYLSNITSNPVCTKVAAPFCQTEWGFNNGTNVLGFCQFNHKHLGVKQIIIRRGLPRIVAVFVLAHEIFHALLYFSCKIYLNLGSSKHFLLKLAHDHGFNQLCQTSEEFANVEEAAAHLFGSQILKLMNVSSEHEKALKTLWMVKVLPQNDQAREFFGPPLASQSIHLWNQAVKLNSKMGSRQKMRSRTFQSFLTILTQLKCIWGLND